MKNKMLFAFLLMITGVAVTGFYAPWWTAAIWVVLIATIMRVDKKQGMFAGAFGFGLVWLGMAWYMGTKDDADIISKTGILLGGLSPLLMLLVTFVIAFITGLLSGWLGSVFGSVVRPKAIVKVEPGN